MCGGAYMRGGLYVEYHKWLGKGERICRAYLYAGGGGGGANRRRNTTSILWLVDYFLVLLYITFGDFPTRSCKIFQYRKFSLRFFFLLLFWLNSTLKFGESFFFHFNITQIFIEISKDRKKVKVKEKSESSDCISGRSHYSERASALRCSL